MSIIPNYLALYNLSQIEADILIVSDLTASRGTIIILNSTTANIITHIGDIWQGTSGISNMRIGSVSDTGGVISVYKTMSLFKNLNINTSNGIIYCSNFNSWNGTAIDINFLQSLKLSVDKNLSLQGTGSISLSTGIIDSNGNISTSAILLSNTIRARTVGSSVNIFDNGSGQINFGNGASTAFIVFSQNLYILNKDILIVGASNKITTPNITLSGTTQSPSKLLLTDSSKNVVSSLYTDTDFARLIANNIFTNNNTIQGALSCNDIRSIAPHTANVNLFPLSTGTINIGLSVGGGNLNLNTNTILSADKYLEITGTGYLILPTAVANTNAFIRCEKYNTWSALNPVSLFTATTGLITLGNTSGTLTINSTTTFSNSMIMSVNANISLSGTGKITVPNILVSGLSASKLVKTDASDNLVSSLYDETTLPVSTPQQTALNLKANIDNPTFTTKITTPAILVSGLTANKMVLTDSSDNLISSSYTDTDFPRLTANNVFSTISGIGNTFLTDIYIGQYSPNIDKSLYFKFHLPLNVADDVYLSLYQTLGSTYLCPTIEAGNIHIGNYIDPTLQTGSIFLYGNTSLASGKNLTMGSSSEIYANVITGLAPATNLIIGETGDTGTISSFRNIVMRGATAKILCNNYTGILTSSNLSLGESGDTGIINCYKNIVMTTGASGNKILCGFYDATSAGADIYIGNNQTSGSIILNNTYMATGKLISITATGKMINSTFESVSPTTAISLFNDITGANINVSNTVNTGFINLNSSCVLPANKTITLNSTGGSVLSPVFNSTSATQALSIGTSNTTANVSLATGLTTATLFLGPTVATSNLAYPQGWAVLNANTYLISGRQLTIDAGSLLFSPMISNANGTFNICCETIDVSNVINIGTKSNNVGSNVNIGNTTAASDFGKVQMNKNLVMGNTTFGGSKTISSNWYYGLSSSSDVAIAGGTTSGVVNIGDSSSVTPFTGGTFNNGPFSVCRYLAGTRRFSYINVGFGSSSTPTLFKTTPLLNKYLTSTMYANAATSEWCAFESDTAGEGSALIQNGDTSCVINAGDQFALWWLDEDTIQGSPAGSTTYAWAGWKISTAGVFTTSSDRRLKRDITPIVDVGILDKLSLLEMVNYKWKAPTEEKYYKNGVLRRKYQEVHTGYIAQDVRQVFPDVVERENADAYWTIKREDLSAKYHLGVQELIKQNKAQQIQIDKNKILIDDLTARLARLEQLLIPTI